jgi:hypothetical protein
MLTTSWQRIIPLYFALSEVPERVTPELNTFA